MKRSPALFVGLATALVVADQWTKRLATEHLAFQPPVRVVGDLVQLTYARNPGIAFGLFAGHRFPFYVFSLIAAAVVTMLFLRHERLSIARQLSLACILGGALGNLIDRVRTGEVVDFILLSWHGHDFPVFNVADIGVTVGVCLFALVWTHDDEPVPSHATESTHEPHAGTDGPAGEPVTPGGPVAGEGADRPLA